MLFVYNRHPLPFRPKREQKSGVRCRAAISLMVQSRSLKLHVCFLLGIILNQVEESKKQYFGQFQTAVMK